MKLVLLGDLVPTAASIPAFEAEDCEKLMGSALKEMRSADFTLCNLECALTEEEKRIRKLGPNLKGKPAYAKVIRDCGIDACGLANNHVMDFGIQGFRDTVKALEEASIRHFGWGENEKDSRKAFFIQGEKKVGIVAVCEHEYSYALPDQMGSTPFDPFETMLDIEETKAQCDYLVVLYHGGKEQCLVPSPRLRKACRAMVHAGADLVLCQHSHCIGCRESHEGGEILYGQGNFNFAKYLDHPHWQTGLMVKLELGEKPTVEYIPMLVTDTGITLAEGAEKEEILKGFASRSEMLQDEKAWMAAWNEFCLSKVENYRGAVKRTYAEIPEGEECHQVFPHYLDCEAHLDVWKTLYQTWHARKETGA